MNKEPQLCTSENIPIFLRLHTIRSICFVYGKEVTFSLAHTIQAHGGSRGISPLIPKLGTTWKWVVNFTPWPPYAQRKIQIRQEKKKNVRWAPKSVLSFGRTAITLAPSVIRRLDRSAPGPVAIPTEPSQLP